jgi:predicted glutamine amidotransferase
MIEMSFQKLMERAETVNSDGWGAVFYEKNDAYVFRDPRPGSASRPAALPGHCGVESKLAISHIRKATGGAVELRNTHPFTREIHGRLHSFAFNGDVPEVFDLDLTSDRFWPIGETDGEYAFCWLLDQFAGSDSTGDWKNTAEDLQSLGCRLAEMGPANFLYSDSLRLYAFASRQRQGDGENSPGLYHLCRDCAQQAESIPCVGLAIGSSRKSEQELTLTASVPLSDEHWTPFESNQLLVIENGRILYQD